MQPMTDTQLLRYADSANVRAGNAAEEYLRNPEARSRRYARWCAAKSHAADKAALEGLSSEAKEMAAAWSAAVKDYQEGRTDWPSDLERSMPRDLLEFLRRPVAWLPEA
jgi:hypothetical protein